MPIIILTAHGGIGGAVGGYQARGLHFLNGTVSSLRIAAANEKRRWRTAAFSEVKRLEGLLREKKEFRNIVARCEKMERVLDLVSRIAGTDATICQFSGESGTGKEVIARAIRLASPRRDKPFVAINCAAIPDTLMESELFGHDRGCIYRCQKEPRRTIFPVPSRDHLSGRDRGHVPLHAGEARQGSSGEAILSPGKQEANRCGHEE